MPQFYHHKHQHLAWEVYIFSDVRTVSVCIFSDVRVVFAYSAVWKGLEEIASTEIFFLKEMK